MQTAMTVAKIIDDINPLMPEDKRSKVALARVLLMCLCFLDRADYAEFPGRMFTLTTTIIWPNNRHRFRTSQIAGDFASLNGADVFDLEMSLGGLLEKNYPEDSLKTHLAGTFRVTCVKTDYTALYKYTEETLRTPFLAILANRADLWEDFVVRMWDYDEKLLQEAIDEYYKQRGYKVRREDGSILAEKDRQKLLVKFSGFNISLGGIPVTVSEH